MGLDTVFDAPCPAPVSLTDVPWPPIVGMLPTALRHRRSPCALRCLSSRIPTSRGVAARSASGSMIPPSRGRRASAFRNAAEMCDTIRRTCSFGSTVQRRFFRVGVARPTAHDCVDWRCFSDFSRGWGSDPPSTVLTSLGGGSAPPRTLLTSLGGGSRFF